MTPTPEQPETVTNRGTIEKIFNEHPRQQAALIKALECALDAKDAEYNSLKELSLEHWAELGKANAELQAARGEVERLKKRKDWADANHANACEIVTALFGEPRNEAPFRDEAIATFENPGSEGIEGGSL